MSLKKVSIIACVNDESWKFVPAPPVVSSTVPRVDPADDGRVIRSVAVAAPIDGHVTVRVVQLLFATGPVPAGQAMVPPETA